VDLFVDVKDLLNEGAYLVVVLQNYREGPEFKTLAWDFAHAMKKHYLMAGCKIWCQDNKTLYPYGYRYSFVPNVHHHECLIFRKVSEDVKKIKKPITLNLNHSSLEEVKQNDNLVMEISQKEIEIYREKAREKIEMEKWKGRNKEVKIENFVNCWTTEEAFKKLLAANNKWCRNRGLYVGDAEGSVKDFEVKINGELKSVGIRSINEDSYKKWGTVAYPDDRFRNEPEKIANFIVSCYSCNGFVRFLGIISKEELLLELGKAEVKYSARNQEKFRTVALEKFSLSGLKEWLEKLD